MLPVPVGASQPVAPADLGRWPGTLGQAIGLWPRLVVGAIGGLLSAVGRLLSPIPAQHQRPTGGEGAAATGG